MHALTTVQSAAGAETLAAGETRRESGEPDGTGDDRVTAGDEHLRALRRPVREARGVAAARRADEGPGCRERAPAALRGIDDAEALVELFLEPPLFVTDYDHWHGTLYTALYRPQDGSVQMSWPGASVVQTLDAFTERELQVPFHVHAGAHG